MATPMESRNPLEQMKEALKAEGASDIEAVGELILSFRRTAPVETSPVHEELLRPNPDPQRLFPDAPNREAVAHNLDQSLRGFIEAHALHRAAHADHGLGNWRDLLKLNMRQVREAFRWFTNGQATVSLLRLEGGRISVALHEGEDFFLSAFVWGPSIVPGRLSVVGSDGEAMKLAVDWLSACQELLIPVRKQEESATLVWRPWHSTAGPDGSESDGVLLSLEGKRAWAHGPSGAWEPGETYAILNRLSQFFPGVVADTCATCQHFGFSGMTREGSGGSSGYC